MGKPRVACDAPYCFFNSIIMLIIGAFFRLGLHQRVWRAAGSKSRPQDAPTAPFLLFLTEIPLASPTRPSLHHPTTPHNIILPDFTSPHRYHPFSTVSTSGRWRWDYQYMSTNIEAKKEQQCGRWRASKEGGALAETRIAGIWWLITVVKYHRKHW